MSPIMSRPFLTDMETRLPLSFPSFLQIWWMSFSNPSFFSCRINRKKISQTFLRSCIFRPALSLLDLLLTSPQISTRLPGSVVPKIGHKISAAVLPMLNERESLPSVSSVQNILLLVCPRLIFTLFAITPYC